MVSFIVDRWKHLSLRNSFVTIPRLISAVWQCLGGFGGFFCFVRREPVGKKDKIKRLIN